MQTGLILLAFSAVLIAGFVWAFRNLPKENWQILACIPVSKTPEGDWHCINLTYYGLITSLAYSISLILFFFLNASKGVPVYLSIIILFSILIISLPASKIIARLVEKKPNGFSVGAASFAGVLASPFVVRVWLDLFTDLNRVYDFSFVILNTLVISYCIGEGIGRLACISFGCCYGKKIDEINLPAKAVFKKLNFVFYGRTKKISYESGLEGERVFPVQAITAIFYSFLAIMGSYLFLKNYYFISFILVFFPSQIWRFLSEFLRADYRGDGKISKYQVMSVISIFYMTLVLAVYSFMNAPLPSETHLFWGVGIFLDAYAVVTILATSFYIFLFTGISRVTYGRARFHIIGDNQK